MRNNPVKPADLIQLTRLKIMLPVSLTGFTGYFLYDPHITADILLITFSILLTAASASVLNQIQERTTDALMTRTMDRPIPAGRITTGMAFLIFFVCLVTGISILLLRGNPESALIAIFVIACYNGAYTYLKRVTPFAIIPGAVAGSLPPLIGWVAAGGGIMDREIVFVEFLLFTGQIPHFWLLLLRYSDDYTRAGFPSLLSLFSRAQVNRITFVWLLTSVFAAIFLCIFEVLVNPGVVVVLLAFSALLTWRFLRILKTDMMLLDYRKYSRLFDLYFLLLLLLLITDRLL